MRETRRQLSLFVNEPEGSIEKIRAEFNPAQHAIIPAHVTLCRENELNTLGKILEDIKSLRMAEPILIEFDQVERFGDGQGLYLSSKGKNNAFHQLRKSALGLKKLIRDQHPHITLMHPRNSICTVAIFEEISKTRLPKPLLFEKISLIEQKSQGVWKILEEFSFAEKS